jgi:hypothetical protein
VSRRPFYPGGSIQICAAEGFAESILVIAIELSFQGLLYGISELPDVRLSFFTRSNKPRALTVDYYQSGVRNDLVIGVAMPDIWTTLRVVASNTGSIAVYASDALVYSTNSGIMASATGTGLYNNAPGIGLTNRLDNFTVFAVP